MDNNVTNLISYKKIIADIEKTRESITGNYKRWYIGVTNNVPRRKNEHKNKLQTEPYFFYSWYAYSNDIAKAIETYFHEKGMLESDLKGNTKENTRYVYIYKQKPDILDKILRPILDKTSNKIKATKK